jgi:pyruvate kinase
LIHREFFNPRPAPQVNFATGDAILQSHTDRLLGTMPRGRAVRILVTMSSEAAGNYELVRDLLNAGYGRHACQLCA